MNKIKRLFLLLLAALLLYSLAACGKTVVEETPAPEYVYKASYEPVQNSYASINGGLYPALTTPDGFYCTVGEVAGQRALYENEVLEYEGQLDIYETRLYFLGLDGVVKKLEKYEPLRFDAVEGREVGGGVNYLVAAPDGGFYTLDSRYESWSDVEGAERYSDEWYAGYHYEQKYYIRHLDADGGEISCVEMDVEPLKQDEYFYVNGLAAAGENRVMTASDTGLYFFDVESGQVAGSISGMDYPDTILTLKDGRVAVSYWGENGQTIAIVDTEKDALGDKYAVQGDMYRAVVGGGDYDFYYTNGVNFFGYRLETGESEKLFNWINCDVDNSNINAYTVTEEGKIIAIETEWDSNYEFATNYLVTMEKVPASSLPQKETITLTVQYLDWQARSQIINFNRSHDSVRIELQDYSEYNTSEDYGAGLTKLRTEILAGNCPDIISLDGLPAKQLAAKGILADLYPLIDADPELKREDFFPAVLKAMENNGKLYSTCSSFEVISAVGAANVVGTEPGWTYAELMAALQQMPEGSNVFSNSETRYDILQLCLMLDMDRFVNWNTGEVCFDSPEFVELLNFAGSFPADFDWENYEWIEGDDDYSRMRDGKQLLMYADIYNFDSISQYENIFGGLDAFTFIGFPTAEGVGNMLMTGTGYGISEKCKNKEAAWEFVRIFMTEEYQNSDVWNFPSNLHSYELKKQKALTPTYLKDQYGSILLDENGEMRMESIGGYWDNVNEEWVDTYFYTPEEIAKIEAVINSADRVYGLDESISDIVSEQVEAFFAGQRSAEDVAKLIQSKAKIYVNEQR